MLQACRPCMPSCDQVLSLRRASYVRIDEENDLTTTLALRAINVRVYRGCGEHIIGEHEHRARHQ